MKKKIFMVILFLVVLIMGIVFMGRREITEEPEKKVVSKVKNTQMNVVTSLEDKIAENTAWCGTFNLIWNDLKNDLAEQDIVFSPQPEAVKNLNKGTFHTGYLSEDSYYKVYGNPSLDLKAEIEKAIQEKFNETSDILDDFNWNNANPKDYFLYAMLKKEFEFPSVFTELEDGKFGNYKEVKYFGIDGTTDNQVRNQVEVLYYNSKEDFAIKLLTKSNDEVVIAKGNEKNTFGSIYEDIKQKSESYEGNSTFAENDTLKIPTIDFNLKEEIEEVENQPFLFANGDEYTIEQALQTIQFELDKKGGKIKSEAGMMARLNAAIMLDEPREFVVDDTFTIFLVEENQDLPYFAAKISDISNVQEKVEKVADSEKENQEQERVAYFYGKVIESSQNRILVEPKEGEKIRNSATQFWIGLGKNSDVLYEEGTNVKITYDGTIMTTEPPQINALNIELKSVEDFEIRFFDKSIESKQKVRSILEQGETKKYDYNVYAYMGEVNILLDGKEMPLRDALLENKITMEEIIAKANQDLNDGKIKGDSYFDGGSIEYHYENYTIIKVHKANGNRDVYIGTMDMTLNDLGL